MPAAARITDNHVCPKVEPGPVPHVGGPVVVGSADVLIAFVPAARVGDMLVCVGPPDTISAGASNVLINHKEAARLGDPTDHGGTIVMGAPNVLIGTSPQSFTLTGAAASGAPFCEECEKARKKLEEEAARRASESNSVTTADFFAAQQEEASAFDGALGQIYRNAAAAKQEIDQAADEIAGKVGAPVPPAKAPLKRVQRVIEKANNDYGGDVKRVKDIARNTIVVKAGDEHKALELLKQKFPDLPPKNIKIVAASADPCGYSGLNVSVPTKNGPAEIQINNPAMIFAKEKPADAKRILGPGAWDEIAARPGMPEGGQGHQLYERYRSAPPHSLEASHAAAESRAYYAAVRAAAGGG